MKKGHKLGLHRVIKPTGVLPQPADVINNDMEIYDNEILIDVDILNIDSASFTQLKKAAEGDEQRIAQSILEIVGQRGKMQNPVTGSGGMLIGTVSQIGDALKDHHLKPGDKIATLVSLSLTPLRIKKIIDVKKEIDQVAVKAQAILFESGLYAKLPDDMPAGLALAVLDVAGAPAQTRKLVKSGDLVLVVGGGGKSGLLCLHEAKKQAGPNGRVIALDFSDAAIANIRQTGLADGIIQADARDAVAVLEAFEKETGGAPADLVINNVNIPDCEMSSILCTKDQGKIYFFSMATSFTKAALGAEGVGKDVEMIIGNGYTKNHADIALQILRDNKEIRELYTRLYS